MHWLKYGHRGQWEPLLFVYAHVPPFFFRCKRCGQVRMAHP